MKSILRKPLRFPRLAKKFETFQIFIVYLRCTIKEKHMIRKTDQIKEYNEFADFAKALSHPARIKTSILIS